jgi:hypothetical protein
MPDWKKNLVKNYNELFVIESINASHYCMKTKQQIQILKFWSNKNKLEIRPKFSQIRDSCPKAGRSLDIHLHNKKKNLTYVLWTGLKKLLQASNTKYSTYKMVGFKVCCSTYVKIIHSYIILKRCIRQQMMDRRQDRNAETGQ